MINYELVHEHMDTLMREAEQGRLGAVARAASRDAARQGASRPRLRLRLLRLATAPWSAASHPYDCAETR